MASDWEPKISDLHTRGLLQVVAFPYADPEHDGLHPFEVARREAALVVLARMLKTTVAQLKKGRAEDRITWAERPREEMNMTNEQASESVIAEGWDEVDKSVGSAGGWMKWTDGQVHSLNVFGIPKHIEKDFGDGKGPKTRVSLSVFIPGEGVKTWEMSPGTYRDLKEERLEAGAKFGVSVFKVKRVGTGSDTRYKFRLERALTEAELKERDATGGNVHQEDGIPF